jgi:hypothetical protein
MMNAIHSLQAYPMPSQVIIGVEDYLTELKSSINQANLPTIDIDVLLSRIVESVSHYVTAENEITALPDALIQDDILDTRACISGSSNFYECITELERVFTNIVKVSYVLCRYFKQHGLYVDQYLVFEYGSMIDDKSIVLRRRR